MSARFLVAVSMVVMLGLSAVATSVSYGETISSTGLQLWLRADAVNGAGNALPNNGNYVNAWTDTSGNGLNVLQSGSTDVQPTFVSSGVGGMPVLRFDGNDTLTTASATKFNVGSSGDITYFAVFMANDVTERGVMGSTAEVSPHSRFGLFFPGSGMLRYGCFGDDRAEASGFSTSTYYIAEGLRSGTSLSAYVDGSLSGTGTGVSNVTVTATTFTAGGMLTALVPTLDGDIAEIIIYNRTLSDAERNVVGAYLQSKYSISGEYVPEPGTLALLATGLIGLLCYAWRKRK